jgi:hypothetical protein
MDKLYFLRLSNISRFVFSKKNKYVLLLSIISSSLFSQIRKDLNSFSPAERTTLVTLMQEYITKKVIEDHCYQGNTMVEIHDDVNFLPFHRAYIESMEDFLVRKGYSQFVPLPYWTPSTAVPMEFRVVDQDCSSAICDHSVWGDTLKDCSKNINWAPGIQRPSYINLPVNTGSNNDLCDYPFITGTTGLSRVLEGELPNSANSTYHNSVHSNMNGAMGVFTSPAAPVFWCFHALIDDIWKQYECVCPSKGGKPVDLYMKDTPKIVASERDIGKEPNIDTGPMNASTDIWVRNQNDGILNQSNQNPVYSKLNYIYVRVRNRGCETSTGTEQLKIHWAKAATDLTWPSYWDGSITTPALMGNLISTVTIPAIVAGGSTILVIQWFPPNSTNYSSSTAPKLFSLLARIIAANDPMTTAEGTDVVNNARKNNNIVMKDVTVDVPPNVSPFVTWIAPADHTTLIAPANIAIQVNASDDDGSIGKVEFYQGTTLLGSAASSPYVLNWNNVAAGTYTLTAKAMDDLNASTTSAEITLIVKTNSLPTVTTSAPLNGASFIAPATIHITANANDSDGNINHVSFYEGTALLGTDSIPPYVFDWTIQVAGTYTLTAKATDNTNGITVSDPVTIFLNTNSPPAVSIIEPTDGTQLTEPAHAVIKANASDVDGIIQQVEFYDGTTLLGIDSLAPYLFDWNAIAAGTHHLTAKAVDDLNAGTVSTETNVIVKTNNLPSVAITNPFDGKTFVGPATINIIANAADNDGTIKQVEFYEGISLLETDSIPPYQFEWKNVAVGTYTLSAKAIDNLNGVASSAAVNVSVKTNSLPSVAISEPLDGTLFVAPPTIRITAAANDSDGSIKYVAFYEGNTLLGSDTTSPYTINWSNVTTGIHFINAKAVDNLNDTALSANIKIRVNANSAPSITITNPLDASQFVAPATILLKAVAFDKDGIIKKVEFYNGTTLLETDSLSPYEINWKNVPIGTYNITAKATDELNAVTLSNEIEITVKANAFPTVNIVEPFDGETFIAPAIITLKANAMDGDGGIQRVEFYGGSALLDVDSISPYRFEWKNAAAGNYTLTAIAIDDLNAATVSNEIKVKVNTNSLPVISITAPVNSLTLITPATTLIKASASDTDGSIQRVEFYEGAVLLGIDSIAPYIFEWKNIPAGNYNIIAKAIDDLNGASVAASVQITVIHNNAPQVAITEPSDGTILAGPVTFIIKADASDSDGTVKWVEFYQGTDKLMTDSVAPYQYTWNNALPGTYALTAKVRDDLNSVSISVPVNITITGNSLPVTEITYPSTGNVFLTPVNITIEATATDVDGAIHLVEFYEGSHFLGVDSISPYTFDWNNVAEGNYTLLTKAIDNLNAVTSSAEVKITVENNSLPFVSITAPADSSVIIFPNTVELEADASDVDGTVKRIEFYNGASLIGTSTTFPFQFNWKNAAVGVYHLTAKAVDDQNGFAFSDTITINVIANALPTVSITAPPTGTTLLATTNTTIKTIANDADGYISRVEFYLGTSILGADSTSPYLYTWNNLPLGMHSIVAKAYDNRNTFRFSDTVKINVVPNALPVATLTKPTDGNTFIAPALIAIRATAGDADGSITKVEFYEGTTLLQADSISPYAFDWKNVQPGLYVITAKATDDLNATRVAAPVNIKVNPNNPPGVNITSPQDASYFITPTTLTIKATAIDSDGSIQRVEFYEGAILLEIDSIAPFAIDWKNIPAGTYALTAKAVDNLNAQTISDTVKITVHANQLPSIAITEPVQGTVLIAPAYATIKATATDGDGSIQKVAFYLGATLLETDSVPPFSVDWKNISAGIYTLTAIATDNLGAASTSAPVGINVNVNSPPSIDITEPLDAAVFITPATITVKATATDTDGSIKKVEFYEGNHLLQTDSIPPYSMEWKNMPVGTYTLTAKAIDNLNAATVSGTVNVNVHDNDLPSVSITDPPTNLTLIAPANYTIKATATDSDGSIKKVEFYSGTTLLKADSTVPYSYNLKNLAQGIYTITAKAIDNLHAETVSAVVIITVNANTPPVVMITEPMGNNSFIAPATIVIKANATDTDGNIHYVEFYEGSHLLEIDSIPPYTLDWKNIPAGTYTLTAKAIDNLNAATVSSGITILVTNNSLPEVSIISPLHQTIFISPANILIKANASDKDGSIKLVEFYEGSNLLARDSVGPYLYNWTNVTSGVYTLTAKAFDDRDAVFVSDIVKVNVVSNIPPTVVITSPANKASFISNSNIILTADAADTGGSVSRVEFYENNILIGADSTSPYAITWKNVPKGSYALLAKAIDDLNAFAISDTVHVEVADNTVPVTMITKPYNGQGFYSHTTITVFAHAIDDDGSIRKVDFYQNNAFIGSDSIGPYTIDWPDVPAGTYALSAKATDNLNAEGVSDVISITVADKNMLPVVQITSPLSGDVFHSPANLTLEAHANDNDGSIVRVEFYEGSTFIGADSTSPFTMDLKAAAAGTYHFMAKAYDELNAFGTSDTVLIYVIDNNAPLVKITSPADGSVFTAPANFLIEADATDNDGIKWVEFYSNDTLIGTDSVSPYYYNRLNVAPGNYLLKAIAYNTINLTGTSSVIKVRVQDISTSVNSTVSAANPWVLYPVPFDSKLTLEFSLSQTQPVIIKIYNETGKEMISLINSLNKGNQTLSFNTAHLPAGIYFCTMQVGKEMITKKIVKIAVN